MAKIIDGKEIAASLRQGLKEGVAKNNINATLAVVLVGEDEASRVYVKNKILACQDIGIKSNAFYLSEIATEKEVLELIDTLNGDKRVSAILVQLPLPKHINESTVLSKIDPEKDVDGFSFVQSGKLFLGKSDAIAPCTPKGCIQLIKSTGVSIAGKNAVVVGRSNIVGKPMAMLLLNENATVTICHSKTANLKNHTKNADILIVAVGIKHFISADMIKKGAIVIDVGINRENGKLYGDVDFENAKKVAGYITPVPGGVGPMTIANLLLNTVELNEAN